MVAPVVQRAGLRLRSSRPSYNGLWRLGIGLGDFACEWLLIMVLMGGQPAQNTYSHALFKVKPRLSIHAATLAERVDRVPWQLSSSGQAWDSVWWSMARVVATMCVQQCEGRFGGVNTGH